ncbi:MAG TPA: Smr/MutS family protein [Anaerolineales bacterium]|nr:Smr/MutS family protein [Anaerolineales bacterium]
MNNQIRSTQHFVIKIIGSIFFLLVVFALSSCASKARAEDPSCYIDMGMRVTINVTDVKLQVVTDQLAAKPDCAITVSPFIRKHVTVNVENKTVSEVIGILCPQIRCKWILNENHLTIRPYTIIDKWQDNQWVEMQRVNKILQNRLPECMVFEDVPLSAVLKEISKATGLTIKAWEDEGDRKVTIDVRGMTVDEALRAVVRYVDGEGVVLIKSGGLLSSYSQHWMWNYP